MQLERVVAPRHLARIVAVGADVEADAEAAALPRAARSRWCPAASSASRSIRSISSRKLHAQRIELVRTIERDDADLAVNVVENLRHARFPNRWWLRPDDAAGSFRDRRRKVHGLRDHLLKLDPGECLNLGVAAGGLPDKIRIAHQRREGRPERIHAFAWDVRWRQNRAPDVGGDCRSRSSRHDPRCCVQIRQASARPEL